MNGAASTQPPLPHRGAPLDAAALRASLMLPAGGFARVDVVDSSGSTNADLAAGAVDPAQNWPDCSVLIANAQPAGKGRMGRVWEVPAGAAMISSVLLHPGSRPDGPGFETTGYGWLSIMAGVALCQALHKVAGVPAELKWPNDVLIRGRKVAGILAHVVAPVQPGSLQPGSSQAGGTTAGRAAGGPAVIVGVGVNVSLEEKELPTDRATSLLVEGASQLDRNVLLPAYLNTFISLYGRFAAAGGNAGRTLAGGLGGWGESGKSGESEAGKSLLEMSTELMTTLGQEVRAELPGGAMLHGTATGLRDDGALMLRDGNGTVHAVSAGDVIHLRRTLPDGTVHYG